MLRLLSAYFRPELLTNVRVDEAIEAVFDQAVVPAPYDSSYFILGSSKLGSAKLWGTPANIALDEAKTSLTWAGDIASEQMKVQQYLRDIVACEGGGRFFWNARTGKFTFHNRWRDSVNFTVSENITGDQIVEAEIGTDRKIINHVTLNYTPRAASGSATLLYDSTNVLSIKGAQTKTITMNYQDPANPGSRCAGQDIVITPGTHIVVNTQNDSAGDNITQQMNLEIDIKATAASVTIENPSNETVYVIKQQVLGKPISLLATQTVEASDGDSILAYDRFEEMINLPALDDGDLAQSIATHRVATWSQPQNAYQRITLQANQNAANMTRCLDRTIGDGINLSYDNHDQDYLIVGEEHILRPGGDHFHRTIWTLKEANRGRFFIIGTSRLGSNDRLAF